ncbi:hypothetical protein GCM10008983_17320 [Lentibacillus halophilus]|uniref:DUF2188 domain-containing protein n=1 Tax=Lentibacillus halophilus TaxID=295065 RepID=A0ABP3J3S7_9BACI
MNMYSVAPSNEVMTWFVKLEDVAPEEEYELKDDAIAAAEQMAQDNRPSMVKILDKNHNVLEKRKF